MKRFISTVAFCTLLLVLLSHFLFPVAGAAENPLLVLLNLPAPPPPNPDVPLPPAPFPESFFSKSNPPPDDAPIHSLLEYWRTQSENYNELHYKVFPSEKVLARLMAEMEKEPGRVVEFLNILPRNARSAEFVKSIYDGLAGGNEEERERRSAIKRWLTYNSSHFSAELARNAAKVADADDYVVHHDELIALARVDWERAAPIVNRLYANSGQRASQTAARWALYARAMETGSTADAERYRDELKATVEDKALSDGIRDLALDALSLEKEWNGRDEWYMSLMEDETMLELGTYTGLTTLISNSPDEKYIDRMIALLESDNINVRSAAAGNLVTKLSAERPAITKALLPWLVDAKWLKTPPQGRDSLVRTLALVKMPESVPALIALLDEKLPVVNSNRNANANRPATNARPGAVNSDIPFETLSNISAYRFSGEAFPFRNSAISALAHQADPRAVPALRRLLSEADQPYQHNALVAAIYSCGGYTIAEQVDALEDVARNAETLNFNANTNVVANFPRMSNVTLPPRLTIPDLDSGSLSDVNRVLGVYLAQLETVDDKLARATVERIGSLDETDRKTAEAMRKIAMRWNSAAVNALLLQDIKKDRIDPDAVVRLLSIRRALRETQQSDIFEMRTGGPTAVGISTCLLEDPNDLEAVLEGGSDEAKTAMLACGRLIRAPLSVKKVAQYLQSKNKLLALAAERYLESEDSAESRKLVLSLHPNEAKVMGATTAFYVTPDRAGTQSGFLISLFATVSPFHARQLGHYGIYPEQELPDTEKIARDDIKKETDLLKVYNWEENFIHVYKDRATLSWHEDSARYRERAISREELEDFQGVIERHKAEEEPPFLECLQCQPRQFLVLGRNGGRRVYLRATSLPPFFADLDQAFTDLRRTPATIKYWAAKSVPGLEVLFADERLDAMAVWKSGPDFRLLVADKTRREEIDRELETYTETLEESPDDAEPEAAVAKERFRRQHENFAWFDFQLGRLGPPVEQPAEVPYLRGKNVDDIPPFAEQWKARAGATEIRADGKNLYKIVAGEAVKIRSGYFASVVVTPNGRWAVATKQEEEHGVRLVRINLLTGREYKIDREDMSAFRPIVYIPSINRILVGPYEDYYGNYEYTNDENDPYSPANLYALLEPETGKLTPARGEVRPLIHQTVRPLQTAGAAFEFWAAIPKQNETVIGIYNTRSLTLKPVIELPNIRFNSMDIWVDSPAGKVYFVYRGHLLSVPLKSNR